MDSLEALVRLKARLEQEASFRKTRWGKALPWAMRIVIALAVGWVAYNTYQDMIVRGGALWWLPTTILIGLGVASLAIPIWRVHQFTRRRHTFEQRAIAMAAVDELRGEVLDLAIQAYDGGRPLSWLQKLFDDVEKMAE